MMKDASPPLCKAASGDNDAVPPTDDEGAAVPRLPTTKVNGDSKRSPIAILFLLQVLSLVPAIVGCSTCWKNALSATTSGYSTRLDWAISSFWALATGYSSYSLAAGLLRRWLVFYDLVPAMIRLLGLQAFVWPLTHFTIVTLFPDHPVAGWIICALTASSCNVVQLWVTSNIRIHHAFAQRQGAKRRLVAPWAAAVPYLRQSASRAGTRTIDWSKVVRRTVLPLGVLGYATLATLLWQQYEARPIQATGVFGGRLQSFYSPTMPEVIFLDCPITITSGETRIRVGAFEADEVLLEVRAAKGDVALGRGVASSALSVTIRDADANKLNSLLSPLVYSNPRGGKEEDVITVQLTHAFRRAYGQCHITVSP